MKTVTIKDASYPQLQKRAGELNIATIGKRMEELRGAIKKAQDGKDDFEVADAVKKTPAPTPAAASAPTLSAQLASVPITVKKPAEPAKSSKKAASPKKARKEPKAKAKSQAPKKAAKPAKEAKIKPEGKKKLDDKAGNVVKSKTLKKGVKVQYLLQEGYDRAFIAEKLSTTVGSVNNNARHYALHPEQLKKARAAWTEA